MSPGVLTIDLTSIVMQNRCLGSHRAIWCFFRSVLSIIVFEILTIIWRYTRILGKCDLWPWWLQFWPWKMTQIVSKELWTMYRTFFFSFIATMSEAPPYHPRVSRVGLLKPPTRNRATWSPPGLKANFKIWPQVKVTWWPNLTQTGHVAHHSMRLGVANTMSPFSCLYLFSIKSNNQKLGHQVFGWP